MRSHFALLIPLLIAVPVNSAASGSLEENYPQSNCISKDTPQSDITLTCSISRTITQLVVEVLQERREGNQYYASINVTNTNAYAVHVKTILATARNAYNEAVGHCARDISQTIAFGESFKTEIQRTIAWLTGAKDKSIQSIEIIATPWI